MTQTIDVTIQSTEVKWAEEALFYHVYPLGLCGAPARQDEQLVPRLRQLHNWIPYWQAKGHEDWKRLGFDVAYQQPNHFFNKSIPDSRLDEACAVARKNGMAMEFEFDERATIAAPDTFYDRMLAYIDRVMMHAKAPKQVEADSPTTSGPDI